MRCRALLLVGLLAACAAPSRVTATTANSAAAPSESSTTTAISRGPIRGALPDGTIYDIVSPQNSGEEVREIHADLVADIEDSQVRIAINFRKGEHPRDSSDVVFQAGEWVVDIELPDTVHDEAEEVIADAVTVSTEVEMPVLNVRPPLSWAGPPSVDYETFSVRAGCSEVAVACNVTHAVSVVPHGGVSLGSDITVQSYALRRPADPNYLTPGPLTARWGPDVVWTGREMIVWGGSTNPGPPLLIDGAAYNPAKGEWRVLSPPPLAGEQATRAVWADSRMVVVAEGATLAWDPTTDEWSVLGGGLAPPLDPGMTVQVGSDIVTWTPEGAHHLNADGRWEDLPDPGVGDPGLDGSVLRVFGTQLFAVGQDGCERLVTRLEGGEWRRSVRISLEASAPACGRPNQTAVVDDGLVLWDDTSGAVVKYDPQTDTTMDGPSFPLPALERPSGPINLDGSFLVTADLKGAIYELSSDSWTTVELPGLGNDVNTVWTGEEILMWDKCCYGPDDVDAWRWTPPSQ